MRARRDDRLSRLIRRTRRVSEEWFRLFGKKVFMAAHGQDWSALIEEMRALEVELTQLEGQITQLEEVAS